MVENEIFFCQICKDRLNTVDEVYNKICANCKKINGNKNKKLEFYCWACQKNLTEKGEIAQGVCHNCKAEINRKIGVSSIKQ